MLCYWQKVVETLLLNFFIFSFLLNPFRKTFHCVLSFDIISLICDSDVVHISCSVRV